MGWLELNVFTHSKGDFIVCTKVGCNYFWDADQIFLTPSIIILMAGP